MMGGRNPVGRTPGGDVAGEVVAVGARVAGMRPGDEVLGVARGSFAEYARSSEKTLVAKPRSITYEQRRRSPSPGARRCRRTLAELRGALARDGHIVVVGGGTGREVDEGGGLWELMSLMFRGMVLSRYVRPRELMFFASIRQSDLAFLTDLVEKRELTPVIDRRYPLANAADAIRHLETGHARGKVIVTI